jgi:hypothetical protein
MGLKHLFLFAFLLLFHHLAFSQNQQTDSLKKQYLVGFEKMDSIRDAYFKPWQTIDTTQYQSLYSKKVKELTLEHKNTNTAYLSWNHDPTFTSFLVEMRYDLNKKLFHRKVYPSSSIEIPKNQSYTIFPYRNGSIGGPVTKHYNDIAFKKDPYSGFWEIMAIIPLFLTVGTAVYFYFEKKKLS